MDDIKLALLGDHEAAKRLTDAGVLVPCPFCGGTTNLSTRYFNKERWVRCLKCMYTPGASQNGKYKAVRDWNTRAPILSAAEMEMLEGME